MKKIYLDYAAATPLDDEVLAAMQPYFSREFYNPSAIYLPAKKVHLELEKYRSQVAQTLGARAPEIIFTAGGSEANNLAIKGVMEQYPDAKVLVSAIDHESIIVPAARYKHHLVEVNSKGQVVLDKLAKQLTDDVVLVSIGLVNNEVGTVQPMSKIARLIDAVRQDRLERGVKLPVWLHTDAAQAANYFNLQVASLGVDLMSLNGSKIYGPKQSGALYVKTGISLLPLIDGGGQEWGVRSGTENVAAVAGFATALVKTQALRPAETSRLAKLQSQFFDGVLQITPAAKINGPLKPRSPNNIHVTFAGQDNERLIMQLDEYGVQAASGSACAASGDEPSHVLKAMGFSDTDAQSSLRFTLGRPTTAAEISLTLKLLNKALHL